MSITDYIVEFERLYYKIKVHAMALLDGVPAYQILQSTNLSDTQQQLVRATTTELKYNIMVAELKKILGDGMSASTKIEAVYYGKSFCRKLFKSNYPQKPTYKENIQQDKQRNLRYFQNSGKTTPPDHYIYAASKPA